MKKQNDPRKPLGWLYSLAFFIMNIYFRLRYRLKIDRSRILGIKGPVIAVANHQCNLDFISTALAMWPLKMNYVGSSYFFNGRFLGKLLDIMGVIPKRQFVPDTSAVRKIFRAVENGRNVFIFPEGQVGYFGASLDADEAIGKLIKHLGAPVVNVKLRGGFISYGKWSGRVYPARLEASAELLLSREQIGAMSETEIFEAVKNGIAYNDFEWQRGRGIPSKKDRLTRGLENILYRCPSCGRDFVMTSKRDELRCQNCGYAVRLNRLAFFEPVTAGGPLIYDNIADWFLMQRKKILEETADKSVNFTVSCVLLSTREGSHGYFRRGAGTLSLDKDGFIFDGTRDGAPFKKLFSAAVQTAVTHSADVWGVDFRDGDLNYAFCPEDPRMMIKIVELYRALKKHGTL